MDTVAQAIECRISTKIYMCLVLGHGETRSAHVFVFEIGEKLTKFVLLLLVFSRDLAAGSTGLPNPKKPDPIEIQSRQFVQIRIRNIVQVCGPPEPPAEFAHHDPRVDLV